MPAATWPMVAHRVDLNGEATPASHLLPAPDGVLARRLFAQGLSDARKGDWTIAEDGTLYTLPLGSAQIQIGRIDE